MLRVMVRHRHIIITEAVLDIFRQSRQIRAPDSEKGGIVLGQVSEDNNYILVCRASIPGRTDKSLGKSFHRDRFRAQEIIEYEFYNSRGINTYLGEWHTHPAKVATPSRQDIQMIKDQLDQNEMRVEFILLFIVAHKELFVGLYDGYELASELACDAFPSPANGSSTN
jgi:integrative and conjugative element protein (TIGR02256 family)